MDAGRRAPIRRRAARRARQGTRSARGAAVPARRAARAACESDPWAPGPSAPLLVAAVHPADGSRARRQVLVRLDSPLHVSRDDGGGTAGPGCRAWWGHPGPNDACDGPLRPVHDSPGSDSSGPDGAARDEARAGLSASGAPGRFRGNVAPFFQHGLAGLLGIREHCGVHVDHDLIALARGAGVDLAMQRGLGQQGQRVGLLLGASRRRHGGIRCGRAGRDARPLVQRLAGGVERSDQQGADLGSQPAADDHRAILVLVDVPPPLRVLSRRLPGLGLPVHAPPAPHDALDVRRGARAPDRQQPCFGLGRGHAGQGADLGVGELPAGQRLGQARQRAERAGDPHPLAGGAQVEAHAPSEPGGAGGEDAVPAAACVEVANEGEQAGGRGVEMRGQLGDLVAQAVQVCERMRRGGQGLRGDRHDEPSFSGATLHPEFSDAGMRPCPTRARGQMVFQCRDAERAPRSRLALLAATCRGSAADCRRAVPRPSSEKGMAGGS